MILLTAILVGVLFAQSTYLILQRSFVRILFGIILLANSANLAVLAMSGDPNGKGVPIADGRTAISADPLPQAVILTAIVIGFGVAAYFITLLYRTFLDWKTTDAAELFAKSTADETQSDS